jgi:hypothetical protein
VLAARPAKIARAVDFRAQDLCLATLPAQAAQRSFTLPTANAKDFQDVPELNLVEEK